MLVLSRCVQHQAIFWSCGGGTLFLKKIVAKNDYTQGQWTNDVVWVGVEAAGLIAIYLIPAKCWGEILPLAE